MLRKVLILSTCFICFFCFNSVFAAGPGTEGTGSNPVVPNKAPVIVGADVTMVDPMGGAGVDGDMNELIGRIIRVALGVVGSISLALFTYSGLLWMSAAGNAERVQKAKSVMIWTATGMGIIFLAYALVKTIIESLT